MRSLYTSAESLKMRTAVLSLLVACSLQAVQGLQGKLLDLRDVRVTATAECGVPVATEYVVCSDTSGGECVRTCGRGGGGAIAHDAELAVDGDTATSWQSPPLSFYQSLGETIPSHYLTIDLGLVVHVVEVQVWSGEGELPAGGLELYRSLDGAEFTQVAGLSPVPGDKVVVVDVLNISSQQRELTIQQRADSHARYLQLRLLAPPTSLVTSDPRSVFYSVAEVEVMAVEQGACPSRGCHGEAISRRTLIHLQDPAQHRLLWQRSNQSDVWIMDDVMLIVEECLEGVGGCELGRVREDFNGSLNPLLWDSDSFPDSTHIGPRPCPDLRDDPALLVAPGDQITSRPLQGVIQGAMQGVIQGAMQGVIQWVRSVLFDVEFPAPPPFCLGSGYSPVEVRQCRSIEGVLGECALLALVSSSDCGNCLDQLTFELQYLQESLESARFPGNLTILDELHTDIHSTLDELLRLEWLLYVLRNVVGPNSNVFPSDFPPRGVSRLDLQLVPPILGKLAVLKSLLLQTPTIPVVTRDDLVIFYSGVRTGLEALLQISTRLRADQRALSSLVAVLLRSISENAEAVSVAWETANQIYQLISNRNYSTEVKVQGMVDERLETINRYLGLAQNDSLLIRDVSNSLIALEGPLVAVGNLAMETVGVASDAQSLVVAVEEILDLLDEATELLGEGDEALRTGEVAIATGEQLLLDAQDLSMTSLEALPNVTALAERLNQSIQLDRPRLTSFLMITGCSISERSNCTDGEEHASQLNIDHTYLTNSSLSVYTLRHANDTLTALGSSGMPLDTGLVNRTAVSAQRVAREAIDQLASINASRLGGVVSIILSSAEELRGLAANTSSTASSLRVALSNSNERGFQLDSVLDGQRVELASLRDGLVGVASLDDLLEEATLVLGRANDSVEVVRRVRERVGKVREGGEGVERDITQITDNVQTAEAILQDTQQRFPLVSRLLAATGEQAQAALSNVTSFLNENDRIVRDIDALIARLSDVHVSVSLINSPVRLSSESVSVAGPEAVPYLSLQPPPGRQLGDSVQFEDFDLYLWPSAQYQTPSLIFYAGPVRFPDQQNGTQPETREDVVWVVAEEEQLRLGWELGGYHGNMTYPARVDGESRLRVTRVGSQFKLLFAPTSDLPVEEDAPPINNSLLFHTSFRTAFLLGGWPQGAELGSEVRPLPLSSLLGFEGQFQLALFNGDLWGLWNVRSTSATDLIGDMEFRRNSLSRDVAWHATPGFMRTASVLSFDGSGYLFTEQFGTVTDFASQAIFQTIMIFMRPNDMGRGLVMYAYQTQEGVSLEVSLRDGLLNVLISRHDDIDSEVLVNHTELASPSSDEEVHLRVQYIPLARRYIINDAQYDMVQGARFFTDLQEARAWFGGVNPDQLESSYVPREISGYFGCVDMYVQKNFDLLFEILRGPSFTEHYLNSRVQSGLSATCYATVYTRVVSFDSESEGVAYTYLPLPPRSPPCSPSLPLSLSLSILPLEGNGTILAATELDEQASSVVVMVMRDGVVEVTAGQQLLTLSSQQPLELGAWHHILLSFNPSPITAEELDVSLFVDGILQDGGTLPAGFSLHLPTSAPLTVANPRPVLFVGGVSSTFDPDLTMATFRGCMRDLTFDLCPLSFQAASLVDPHPPGVSYHSCPQSTVVSAPELPVRPDPPQERVCLGAGPVELGSTHGGFARDTSLETSNVAGLYGSQWNLTFDLRQRGDGHVISVRSVSGARVMVSVVGGGMLALTVSCGGTGIGDTGMTAFTDPIPHDTFTRVTVVCSLIVPDLACDLTVAGQMETATATVPVNASVFDPALPLSLGLSLSKQGDTMAGFEGCIRDLAINGDTSGFNSVETGIPCYNQTVAGLGFTGISFISEALPLPGGGGGVAGEVSVSLTVQPLLETGVVLVLTTPTLTTPTTAQPLLAVGLVQGELRVSNFSGGYLILAEGLCNPDDEMTFELVVGVASEDEVSVGVAGGDVVSVPLPLSVADGLVLTVGSIPDTVSSEVDLSFLVGGEAMLPTAEPAGLVGCLLSHSVNGRPLNLTTNEHSNILNGFCPGS